jgi:DNA-binding MarR family transcriptional regulator
MTDHTEAIGRELVTLFRGAKELHHAVRPVPGEPVLDPPAFALLSRLGERGPMRLSALADCLLVDVSTISRQVHDIEQSGWVARDRDPHDGRAYLLRLTDDGRAVLDAGQRQRQRALRQMLAGWDDEDCRTLAEHLGRFNQAMTSFHGAADRGTSTVRQEIP